MPTLAETPTSAPVRRNGVSNIPRMRSAAVERVVHAADALEQHGEFVAAQPRDRVRRAHRFVHPLRGLP